VLAAQAGLQVLSCDETVTALLRRADLTVLPWTKNPKDSVESVLRIEATFRNKKKSFKISNGIAKLLLAHCETLATVGSCRHFGGVIGPEVERISAGVAV